MCAGHDRQFGGVREGLSPAVALSRGLTPLSIGAEPRHNASASDYRQAGSIRIRLLTRVITGTIVTTVASLESKDLG